MRVSELDTPIRKAAGCLIRAKDTEKYLFILRSEYVDNPHTWGIPGGKGAASEDYWTMAVRETKEEIGFDAADCPHQLIGVYKSDWPTSVYKTYAVLVEEEFKPILDWESAEYKWCTLDELPSPLHWGIEALMSNDTSGEILHKWLQSKI